MEPSLVCAVCGREVDLLDPDAQFRDPPVCGACYRSREEDDQLWTLDHADGELDGRID